MKTVIYLLMAGACGASLRAASPEVEALKQELLDLKKRSEVIERRIGDIEAREAGRTDAPQATSAPPSAAVPGEERSASSREVGVTHVPPSAWSPSQPQTLFRAGPAYLNISLGSLLDVGWSTEKDVERLQLGGHDPVRRGFSLPNTELAFDAAVDPYFKGFANVVFKLDKDSGTEVEVEEAFLLTTALPGNLQLKAGQFFTEFGRHNPQHPHIWDFVDQPLVLNRMLGPDGLRNPGARVSWLMPLPFYSELFLGVMNSGGETAFSFYNPGADDGAGTLRVHGRATAGRELRGPGDLVFVPRWAASVDLTDTQTLLFGTSAAFGPNDTGPGSDTQVYGVDAYWKWKSARAAKGFPFVSLQAEALLRRFEAGEDLFAPLPLNRETLHDWGWYAQALGGFMPRWVAGLRGEFVSGDEGMFDAQDPLRQDRTRVAPNLTWYPSEFSKIRLQYNYDRGQEFEEEHSVWLQIEFFLGAHGAHKF